MQDNLRIKIADSEALVDEFAARAVIQTLVLNTTAVLLLPTGNTPLGMYRLLLKAFKQGKVSFKNCTVFNLDEYYPIKKNHPSSYHYYMQRNFMSSVDIQPDNFHIPNGEAVNPEDEAIRYRNLLLQYQPDLAILGIGPGTTCHIGFNERGSTADSYCRYVVIDRQTRQANAANFDNPQDMPTGALTLGIADILRAKRIIVSAKGEKKAWGVARSLEGQIGHDAPASFLRNHPDVIFNLDPAAAKNLKNR